MYRLYFNGISKGMLDNIGPCGCGGIIVDTKKIIYKNNIISSYKQYLGIENTNYAEFMGLLYGLKYAKELNIKNIEIFGNSKLVISRCCDPQYVNECNTNNTNNTKIKDIYDKIKNIENEFDTIEYYHIYEENNYMANKLANCSLKEYN